MAYTFDHVHLLCKDLELTVDYYVKMFDGKVLNRIEGIGSRIVVQVEVGGQKLFLSPKRASDEVEPNSGKLRWGASQIAFAVDDMDAAMKELKAQGAKFEGEPIVLDPSTTIAFIKGPDDVQIELLQRS